MRRPEGVRAAQRQAWSLSDWIVDRGTYLLAVACIAFIVIATPVVVGIQIGIAVGGAR